MCKVAVDVDLYVAVAGVLGVAVGEEPARAFGDVPADARLAIVRRVAA